jgi:hypothetical protein
MLERILETPNKLNDSNVYMLKDLKKEIDNMLVS